MAWGIVGLYFNGHLKHRYRPWWMKYNYILSAGLDAALAVGNFLIFFCLAYPGIELKVVRERHRGANRRWAGCAVANGGARTNLWAAELELRRE